MFIAKTFYNSELKIWSGPKQETYSIYNPDASIGQIIKFVLDRNPNKIGQISGSSGKSYKNSEIINLAINVAVNLKNYGIKQQDVIGLVTRNSDNLAPLVFGVFLNGAIINPLDTSFPKGEMKHMFGITKPKLIFCDSDNFEDVNQSIKELNLNSKIYILRGKITGLPTAEEFLRSTFVENPYIPASLNEGGNQTAAILCSSGTTGLPKGVCLSHKILIRQTMASFVSDDILLCFSSLYWLSGLLTLLFGSFAGATRVIFDDGFSPEIFYNLIETYKVTFFLGPPSQMAILIKDKDIKHRDLSSIRMYLCGGSKVPEVVAQKMNTFLPNGCVCICYGMSEISGLVSNEDPKKIKVGSTGQIMINYDVKIIDESNNSLGINETGEILIKNHELWNGYYANKETTCQIRDKNGWIHSGDLGYFDEDGYLFVVDRKKDIMKYKNFHFYPSEIESVILEMKDVVEVCVFGIPDDIYTDLPAAAIVRKDNTLTQDEVYNYVAQKMSDHKHLRGGVHFCSDLPKTASGKIQRKKVLELCQSKSLI